MIEIGSLNQLSVGRETKVGVFLTDGENEILLPNKFVRQGLKVGEEVEVFVYTDSEDRPVATTQKPHAIVGDFACLKVVDENQHGSFLDWGLDKDLFVPRAEQHDRMVVGRTYVVAVFLDNHTNRVAAASRLGQFFDYDLKPLKPNQEVELLVYGFNDQGTQVLVDDRYSGFVYANQTFTKLTIGQKLKGFVDTIRTDNKLDIRLQRVGAAKQKDASSTILEALQQNEGKIALGDKSSPGAIATELGLSKKAFKAAIGALYKAGKVVPGQLETRLATDEPPKS